MGKKRVKGEGALHDELKKQVGIWLTPEAITSLDNIATALGVSRSELVERFARQPQDEVLKLLGKE